MEVHGIDMDTGSYRISLRIGNRTLRALVPETLIAESYRNELRRDGRPEHMNAYQWLAAHRAEIETALTRLSRGMRPRAPYDRLSLTEET